jgi:cyanate permease
MMTALCYVTAALLAVACGRTAEVLTLRPDGLRLPRRLVVGGFLASAAFCVAILPMLDGYIVILFLGLAIASLNAASGANIALLVDVLEDGTKVGSVSGVIFTVSNLIGIFAPVLAGYILHATGTFNAEWYAGACGLLVGATVVIRLAGDRISIRRTSF